MTPRAAHVRFYVDADILGLGKILGDLRNDVTYPGDPGAIVHKRHRAPCRIARPDVLDTDWIPQVAARGWLIVTRDSMILQNRSEIAAIRENNAKDGGPQPAGHPDQVGPARSVHDAVAAYRGIDRRARPIHLAGVTDRDDTNPARLATNAPSASLRHPTLGESFPSPIAMGPVWSRRPTGCGPSGPSARTGCWFTAKPNCERCCRPAPGAITGTGRASPGSSVGEHFVHRFRTGGGHGAQLAAVDLLSGAGLLVTCYSGDLVHRHARGHDAHKGCAAGP